jgi:hypothetical protein
VTTKEVHINELYPAGTAGGRARGRTRALHLIDVDNLLGDPGTADVHHIRTTFHAYRRLAGYVPGDHVALACAPVPRHAFAVRVAWPGVSVHWRGGADGADLALLDVAAWAAGVDGFRRAVVGSGDRIFLDALERLETAGIAVEVVSRRRSLATALRVRARSVRYLPDLTMGVAA